MINLEDYPIFRDSISTLKATSLDDKNGRNMVGSELKVIDFDQVKNKHVGNLKLCETPKSVDALFAVAKTVDGEMGLVFVEFKNGDMGKERYSVRKKIYDSMLIFTDITGQRISEIRETAEFILVYNESVNQNNPDVREAKKRRQSEVQPSLSFDSIARRLGKLANDEYICFGLDIFQNYCFRKVCTLTEAEFADYLSRL